MRFWGGTTHGKCSILMADGIIETHSIPLHLRRDFSVVDIRPDA